MHYSFFSYWSYNWFFPAEDSSVGAWNGRAVGHESSPFCSPASISERFPFINFHIFHWVKQNCVVLPLGAPRGRTLSVLWEHHSCVTDVTGGSQLSGEPLKRKLVRRAPTVYAVSKKTPEKTQQLSMCTLESNCLNFKSLIFHLLAILSIFVPVSSFVYFCPPMLIFLRFKSE